MREVLSAVGVSASLLGALAAGLVGIASWSRSPRLRHRLQQLQSIAAALPTDAVSRRDLEVVIDAEAGRLVKLEGRPLERATSIRARTTDRSMIAWVVFAFCISTVINVQWSREIPPDASFQQVLPFLVPSYALMFSWMLVVAMLVRRRSLRRQYS